MIWRGMRNSCVCYLASLFVNILCFATFISEMKKKKSMKEKHMKQIFSASITTGVKRPTLVFWQGAFPLNFAYLCLAYHWAFLENTDPCSVNRVLSWYLFATFSPFLHLRLNFSKCVSFAFQPQRQFLCKPWWTSGFLCPWRRLVCTSEYT